MDSQYYITGIGMISPAGNSPVDFWNSVKTGAIPKSDITAGDKIFPVAKVTDFNPQEILGAKGLRAYNEETKQALAALELACLDSGIDFAGREEATGIIFQSVLPVKQNHDFNKERIFDGAIYVNPLNFPAILPNSIPGYAAIRKGFKGINSTICLAEASLGYSLDSAVYEMESGMLQYAFIGGSSEVSAEYLLILDKLNKFNNNWFPGEGACFLLVERLNRETLPGRLPKLYAQILAHASGFDPDILKGKMHTAKLESLLLLTMKKAGLTAEDIGLIMTSGLGQNIVEGAEARALSKVFSGKKMTLCHTKQLTGECFSASQLFQAAWASCVFKEQICPAAAVVDFSKNVVDFSNVNFTVTKAEHVDHILIISMNCFGQINIIILKKPESAR